LQDAVGLLSRQSFDLVLLDVALPDGSGLDLLANLPADTPVVLFSSMDVDLAVSDRIKAILTKTRSSELDVAKLVKDLLVQADESRSKVAA
jgi:CheY-like chemotaxis protein